MSFRLLGAVLIFIALASAGSPPDGCSGALNPFPIFSAPPKFLSSVPNGKLYIAGNVTPGVKVVHLWGTPYEMGYAYGLLLKDDITNALNDFYLYLNNIPVEALGLPNWMLELVREYGIEAALDVTYVLTEPYTAPYYFQELQGIADASGVDYRRLRGLQMFPEMIKAQCSIVGAWGPATLYSIGGSLIQLRALDFTTTAPFQTYPVITVYHPNSGQGHAFATVTWAGFVGAIAGMSSAPLGVCEKVWLGYKGEETRAGIPFHFLMRDMLQWDTTSDQAVKRAQEARRTCPIFLGVGDPVTKFKAIFYSYPSIQVYNDSTYPVYPGHPQMEGVVYIDKHVQPSKNPCLGTLLKNAYGHLDAPTMALQISALAATGDAYSVVYDYSGNGIYFSYASPYIHGGPPVVPGYARQFTKLDTSKLWNEARP